MVHDLYSDHCLVHQHNKFSVCILDSVLEISVCGGVIMVNICTVTPSGWGENVFRLVQWNV